MSETQGQQVPEDDGRAASAAQLQELAGDESAGPGGETVGGAVAGVLDPVEEARQVVTFCVALFVPLYPSLERVYTPDNVGRLAAASVPLMQKYGLSLGGIFERWGPEINFALVAVPLAQATADAVKHDRAAQRGAAEAAAGAGDGGAAAGS